MANVAAADPETKRARRGGSSSSSSTSVAEDLRQQMAQLERQNTTLDAETVELERLLKTKHRQREANETKIWWLEEQLEKERARGLQQQQQQRGNNSENPRIQEALRIYKTGTIELDDLLERQFPELVDNCDFYRAFLDATDNILLTAMLHLPKSVLNEKELMVRLCKYNPPIYNAIPQSSQLKSDAQVLEAVLEAFPHMLTNVSDTVQSQYPLLVGQALARLPLWYTTLSIHYKANVASSLWRNRDVVLGWVRGGGELHDQIPPNLRMEDPEILLASLVCVESTRLEYPTIPPRFRGDKKFLLKAVAKNPHMLQCVANKLKGDVDLAIAALSGPTGALAVLIEHGQFVPSGEGTYGFHARRLWNQAAENIRQRLLLHDAFSKLILGSIHFPDKQPSSLSMLGQDDATSKALTKMIAEFAGVPVGTDLGMLRRARKTLATTGIRWFD